MILAGDIGGTNTRLALSNRAEPVVVETFPSREFETFEDVVKLFLSRHSADVHRVCFGIAGPVQNGRCNATNLPWEINALKLAETCGLPRCHLINDLEANACGIAWLQPEDYTTIHPGQPDAQGNCAVISPGTGLGEAGMFWDGLRHHPFASEGGHADFGPRNELEFEMEQFLEQEFGRVSYEHLLSGPGLFNIYRFLRDTGRGQEPRWLTDELVANDGPSCISAAAVSGRSPLCERALTIFLEVLGAEAGNLALKMMATGGVWLGGGIVAKLSETLHESTAFMSGFTSKGKLSYVVEKIPVRAILNDQAALLGAIRYALDQGN